LPDESCRNCGGTLVSCSLCAECKAVIGMICASCGSKTIEQFHDSCISLGKMTQTIKCINQNKGFLSKIISFT